jgi:hypothetical protein
MEEMQKDCLEQSLLELAALVRLTSMRPTWQKEIVRNDLCVRAHLFLL